MWIAASVLAAAPWFGCGSHAQGSDPPPKPSVTAPGNAKVVRIADVPHIRQKPDFCGEACAAMYLNKLGHAYTQDDVFDRSGTDPRLGRGCISRDMQRALTRIGFQTGNAWTQIQADPKAVDKAFEQMVADLQQQIPSIVCMRYDERPKSPEHFRLILGHDRAKDQIIYHEPAEDRGAYRRMDRKKFQALWPLKYEKKAWTLVRFRLKPGKIAPPPVSAGRHTDADFAQHILALKKQLPDRSFSIVVEKPFVVVGDEPKATIEKRAESTVRWATKHLKAGYFPKDPKHILTIWLFKDKASYDKHTQALWGSKPHTPYGYYSSFHKALVMNIATGGGTLVHEIVHPFVEANFPDCPSWLNEGLGSLYEQCGQRNGRLVGLPNWRLKGLQRAIRAGSLPSFKTLCATTTQQFYSGKHRATNYAQARYLLYELQQRQRLRTFYQKFHANRKTDPTGYRTLLSVLGETDQTIAAFQKGWEKRMLGLRYP